MVKKILFILLIILFVFSGCISSLDWVKTDFEAYAASDAELNTFPLKYYGSEINLKLGIVCVDYIDSRYTIDVLPVREIADYIEDKYGVIIDTQEFESHKNNGHFENTVSYNADGDQMIEFDTNYLKIDGFSFFMGVLTQGRWATVSWSENPENESIFKYEEGKSNQLQMHIAIAPIGVWFTFWLRIKDDELNRNGYYDLTIVAQERIKLPFKPGGCDLEGLVEIIKQIPELLRQQE